MKGVKTDSAPLKITLVLFAIFSVVAYYYNKVTANSNDNNNIAYSNSKLVIVGMIHKASADNL